MRGKFDVFGCIISGLVMEICTVYTIEVGWNFKTCVILLPTILPWMQSFKARAKIAIQGSIIHLFYLGWQDPKKFSFIASKTSSSWVYPWGFNKDSEFESRPLKCLQNSFKEINLSIKCKIRKETHCWNQCVIEIWMVYPFACHPFDIVL